MSPVSLCKLEKKKGGGGGGGGGEGGWILHECVAQIYSVAKTHMRVLLLKTQPPLWKRDVDYLSEARKKKLNRLYMRRLRHILEIRRQDQVLDGEVLEGANINSVHSILARDTSAGCVIPRDWSQGTSQRTRFRKSWP